jgi:glycosyltransferase involved in cell wall biosynthesis
VQRQTQNGCQGEMLTIRETPEVPLEQRLGRRDFFSYPRVERVNKGRRWRPGRRPIIEGLPETRYIPDNAAKVNVSAVIITYNESRNIRRTLARLYWCDEIVILDSYSTDDTVAICREFGCRVYFKTFEGYGAQKKYAVEQANNDWVLCLDADEVLSEALIREIIAEFKQEPSYTGFLLPMNLVFLGREFRYGKESQRYFLRLFHKGKGNFNEARVHERIELEGKTRKMKHALQHYSYNSLRHWYEKMDRYTTLGAEEAVRKGKNKGLPAVLMALPYYFLRYYFMERNFLNGLEGFYWSVFNSYYHFTKYAKIRELHAARKCTLFHLY